MVKFIILSLGALKEGKILKTYKFKEGLNVIHSQKTSQGKTSLIGIIDYCLNGQDVFPWANINKKYDEVSMEIKLNEKKFLIKRGLIIDKGKIKIFTGESYKVEIQEDITTFLLREIGIKHSITFAGGKVVRISIRDYLKLFFIRQLDTKNLSGNPFIFNKVVQAGKVALGLEEKGLIETRLKEVKNEIEGKTSYLEKLRDDLGRDLEKISPESLEKLRKKFNETNQEIEQFEEKLNEGKNHKIPLLSSLKKIEDSIRDEMNKNSNFNEELLDLQIMKKEILLDYSLIKKSEVSFAVLEKFPDKKCPECETKLDSEGDIITCKLCGSKIEHKKELISHFYKITKNIERDLFHDELRLKNDLDESNTSLKKLKKEYDSLMTDLSKIEESVILRFTQKIKEFLYDRDQLVREIKEIEIKIEYKNKIDHHATEISLLKEKQSNLYNSLNKFSTKLKIFEDHKEVVEKYLKELEIRYHKIEWQNENIFPVIDGKKLEGHGGSDYVRILTAVLSSLFELSLRDNLVKIPSLLIIDSLRKHEIGMGELETLVKMWLSYLEEYDFGQIILTGVEIPDYLINKAQENESYYFIPENKFTL